MADEDDSWVGLGEWADVSGGLRMYLIYLIVALAFGLILGIVTVTLAMPGRVSALASLASILKISGIVGIVIAVFGLVALARYARVAAQTGARGAAQAAFVFGCVGLVISAVSALKLIIDDASYEQMTTTTNVWDLLAKAINGVALFCFLASMRTTAGYIGRLDLHALASTTMVLLGVTITLAIFTVLLARAQAPVPMLLFGLGALGIGIWWLVYMIMLLSRLAGAVRRDAHLPQTFA